MCRAIAAVHQYESIRFPVQNLQNTKENPPKYSQPAVFGAAGKHKIED